MSKSSDRLRIILLQSRKKLQTMGRKVDISINQLRLTFVSQLQNTRWIFSWENARLFTVNFIAVKTSDVLPSHCESKSFVIKVIWKISTAWTSNWVYTELFLLFESKIKKNNLVIFYSIFFWSRVNCQTLPFLFPSWMAGCI